MVTINLRIFTLLAAIFSANYSFAGTVDTAQRMLNQLGYNSGPVDGAYGKKTRGALEAFYADNGGTFDGKLDANEVADLTQAMSQKGISLGAIQEHAGVIVEGGYKPYITSARARTKINNENNWWWYVGSIQADMNGDGYPDSIHYGTAPLANQGTGSGPGYIEKDGVWRCVSGCQGSGIKPFDVRLMYPGTGGVGKSITHLFDNSDTPVHLRAQQARVHAADFNGDGRSDLYIADTGHRPMTDVGVPGKNDLIYLSKPNGTWKEVSQTNVKGKGVLPGLGYVNFSHASDVGDIDGDGDVDVVLGSPEWFGANGRITCLINDGNGVFTTKVCGNQRAVSVSLGDFDGDGDLDLFTSSWHLSAIKQMGRGRYNQVGNDNRAFVGVYRNDGNGNFKRHLSNRFDATKDKNGFYLDHGIHQISYDWDNDGDIDILSNEVTYLYASQAIVMYENDGTGKRFSSSVAAHIGANEDDTGPKSFDEWADTETSRWNVFGLRLMAQDYNGDGLMDFSIEGSPGFKKATGDVFINMGNMNFEHVEKGTQPWWDLNVRSLN